MRPLLHALFLLLLFPLISLAGPVKFEARPHANHIAPDENLEINFVLTIEGRHDIGEIEFPKFEGFQVVSQDQSSGQQVQIINGKITQTQTVSTLVILSPQKKGRVPIKQASIRVDGQTYHTDQFYVQIDDKAPRSNNAQNADPWQRLMDEEEAQMNALMRRSLPGLQGLPQPGQLNPNDQDSAPRGGGPPQNENFEPPRGSVFVRAVPTKTEVFKGEALTIGFYLYMEEARSLQSLDFDQLPHLKGFWQEDKMTLTDLNQMRWESVRVGAKYYNRALLHQVQVYPLSDGEKTIDAMKLKVGVIGESRRRLGFGFSLPQIHKTPIASRSEKIRVRALPDAGRTKDFMGAVGKFTIEAESVPPEQPINKAMSFRVRIQGDGNFNAIDQLNFTAPTGLEFFDSKVDTKPGQKNFEYVLVPRTPGKMTLPAIPFTYFDPKEKKYVSIATQARTFTVTGQANSAGNPNAPLSSGSSASSDTPSPSTDSPQMIVSMPSPLFVALRDRVPVGAAVAVWTLFLGMGGFRIYRRTRGDTPKTKAKPLDRQVREWTKTFKLNPPPAAQMENIRYLVLDSIFKTLPADERTGRKLEATKDKAAELQLDDAMRNGLPKPIYDDTRTIFSKLDSLAFGGRKDSEKLQAWNEALGLMKSLSEKI